MALRAAGALAARHGAARPHKVRSVRLGALCKAHPGRPDPHGDPLDLAQPDASSMQRRSE